MLFLLVQQLLTETGAEPIHDGVMVIHQGRIVAVGNKSEVNIPEERAGQ
jgi:imidazolonepropionase-like amidohydrolase